MSTASPISPTKTDRAGRPLKVGFVLHVMQVAGAEVLVAETIRRLGSEIVPTVFCLDGVGALGEEMLREQIPVVTLGRRPGIDLQCARRFRQEIRQRGIDVIHAHQYTPFFYSALAVGWQPRRPGIIFTEHGRHFPDVVAAKRRVFNRLVLSHMADRVTCVCEFSARSVAAKDGFAQPIQIVPNGIDAAKYSTPADRTATRLRLGLDPERRYVACIARFHPVKDHAMLLSAFANVAAALPDADLLLVGDGPLRPDLERQTAGLGLTNRVRFLGVRNDVAAILGAVDVFALTSVSEAASITLLEAMATGLPTVVTDVGGNPEMLRHRQEGLLVPRGDAAAMATSLLEIMTNPALAASLGRQAADRVHRHYDLDDTIQQYARIYREVMPA